MKGRPLLAEIHGFPRSSWAPPTVTSGRSYQPAWAVTASPIASLPMIGRHRHTSNKLPGNYIGRRLLIRRFTAPRRSGDSPCLVTSQCAAERRRMRSKNPAQVVSRGYTQTGRLARRPDRRPPRRPANHTMSRAIHDPRCSVAVPVRDADVVIEGDAARMTEPGALARIAKGGRTTAGRPNPTTRAGYHCPVQGTVARTGPHRVRSGRGCFRVAQTCYRRRSEATSRRWFRRCSRRLALVTATSASTGAIMSAAASSVRCSTAGRRAGPGAGDQVMVTDSHHPALRMAPVASARRQCPGTVAPASAKALAGAKQGAT